MKKISIYPFTYDNRELLNLRSPLSDYELSAIVPPDQSYHKLFEDKKVKIFSNFTDCLPHCESVLFLGGLFGQMGDDYKANMSLAADAGKEILIDPALRAELPINYEIPHACIYEPCESKTVWKTDKLRQINVPVIGVFGVGKYCNKFGYEIMLRRFFQQKGHSVFQISSKDTGLLFGMEKHPDFMSDDSLSMFDRTLMLNNYVYTMTHELHPDIVIIGVDEGIMPFNRKILNNFGHQSIIVGDAFDIDYGILGINYQSSIDTNVLNRFRNYCRYRINTVIDCFIHSNTAYLIDNDDNAIINYYHLDKAESSWAKLDDTTTVPVVSFEDDRFVGAALDSMYSELLNNVNVL